MNVCVEVARSCLMFLKYNKHDNMSTYVHSDRAATPMLGGDDMAADANNSQPKGGWILVGFPETHSQAVLLEKNLSGFELPKPKKPGPPKITKDKKKKKDSRLALPPSPPPRVDPFPS